MAKPFYVAIDLNFNEIQNGVLQNLATAPANAPKGAFYYDTDDDRALLNIGTAGTPVWKKLLTEDDGSASFAGLTDTDITTPSAGQLPIYDGVSDWVNKSVSGDISLSAAGVATIASDAVTYDKMQDTTAADVVLGKVGAAGTVSEVSVITDMASASASSLVYSSVVKAYIDGLVDTTLKAPDSWDASGGTFPTDYKGSGVVSEGDTFYITVAGTMGSGTVVNVGDLIVANTDTPGQTDANWYVLESNRDQATESVAGVAKIATQAITDAGTNDTDIVTPLKLETFVANTSITRKYAADFLTTDWVGGSAPYTLTIAAATHGLGATKYLEVSVYEDGAPNVKIEVDISISDAGEVVITSNTVLDGHIVIVG